jgi:hypothetical protein
MDRERTTGGDSASDDLTLVKKLPSTLLLARADNRMVNSEAIFEKCGIRTGERSFPA